ncbi:unnamed protein product [Amaranthus hypochondriacus]
MNRERPQGQGRRRINIEKIVDKSKQQVTFCKRRKGIFTKASELCTLCNAEVAILTFSSAGKIFSFGHPSADQVVNRYVHQTKSESESESSDDGELWWEKTIDECLGLEELKTYKSSLEELRDNSENNKFKVKEGEVLVDVFVGNVTDLDDKRLVPTGSNPLHNR